MRINRQRHRPLEVSIGGLANRDPMFAGHWYGPDDTLPVPTAPVEVPSPQWDLAPLPPPSDPQQNDHVMRYWTWLTSPAEVPCPQWDLAPLPPPSDPQQNDHVMRYWTWRLDRMEKRDGR
jgi:hypothetical protein